MIRTYKDIIRELFKNNVAEKFLRKLTVGKPPSHLICKLVPNHYQYPKGSFRRFKWKDIILEGDISNYLIHFLYFGFYEPTWEKLFSLLNPGDVVVDIGSFIGAVSLQAARIVGNAGFVYSFEPHPLNYAFLLRNIVINNITNIRAYNLAVGSEEGIKKMNIEFRNSAALHIIESEQHERFVEVNITYLEKWYETEKPSKVNMIKIDTEGYEMQVLMGSRRLIKEFLPILVIEVNDRNLKRYGSSEEELIKFLSRFPYEFERVGSPEHYDLFAIPYKK